MKKNIQIVLDSGGVGWILEALANKCYKELDSDRHFHVSFKVGLGDPGKDVYIHFIYLSAQIIPNAINIVYVTHVDRWHKAFRLIRLARSHAYFVTMSTATQALVNRYIGPANIEPQVPKSLHFKYPLTHNNKITFGIFSNIYPDKRKNDKVIMDFLSIVSNYSNNIHVIIMGSGYQEILETNIQLSCEYLDSEFNVKDYRYNLDRCDYVLYFGKDEGAISILDAATLNKPIIAINQGFHSDIPLSIYSKLCQSPEEMLNVIQSICTSTTKRYKYLDWGQIVTHALSKKLYPKPSFLRFFAIPFVKNEFSIEGSVNMRKLTNFLKKFLGRI